MSGMTRMICGLGVVAAVASGAGHGVWAKDEPIPAQQEMIGQTDPTNRFTVEVRIDGRGPFPFIVDTGAERTVISTELAGQLRLAPAATAQLLTLSELSTVPTVLIPRLSMSGTVIEKISAPALARNHLGAAGILGIDTLQNQRVVFDFKRARMTVMPSALREERVDGDEIVVKARSRFGRLVLADASTGNEKINVIIDSGAQLSIGNSALLRRLIARHDRHGPEVVELNSVTGGKLLAKAAVVRDVRIGTMHIRDMPIVITDSEVFRKLGLQRRPTLLLGMDVLRSFDRVSIDFANRKVRFLLPGEALRAAPIRNADSRAGNRIGDVS